MVPPQRRPFTDLTLIAIFKQLTPNSQLKAAAMSSRCALLVRAANHRLKSLVITDWADLRRTWEKIAVFSLAAKPSMSLLVPMPDGNSSSSSSSEDDYPLKSRASINRWSCLLLNRAHLQLDSPATVAAIVTLFPGLTELQFIACNSNQCERLVDLLLYHEEEGFRARSWAGQLTSLMVTNFYSDTADLARRLIGVINDRLLALRHLAIHWDSDVPLPELAVLSRLRVLSIRLWPRNIASFLLSLERFAGNESNNNNDDNNSLAVHLLHFSGGTNRSDTVPLLGLDCPAARKRIVRYGWDPLHFITDNVPLLCERFSALTSLALRRITSVQLGPLFASLSPLSKLVHLHLVVSFERDETERRANRRAEGEEDEELPEPPDAQVPSTQALDLQLTITAHQQVAWLNLQWTLPALQAIHLKDFHCRSCRVSLRDVLRRGGGGGGGPEALSETARQCLQTTLPALHPGVHHRRIILGFHAAENTSYTSLEQFLASLQ